MSTKTENLDLVFETQLDQELLDRFRADLKVRSIAVVDDYVSIVRRFANWLHGQNLTLIRVDKKITKNYLIHLKIENGLKYNSLRRTFACLATFYEFLIEEELCESNPINSTRKRYLKIYKDSSESRMRRALSIDEARRLVHSILDTRDKTILVLLLKTGMRRKELVALDINDIDLEELTITLKPTPKRSNRLLLVDYETANLLKRYLKYRESLKGSESNALFLSHKKQRISVLQVWRILTTHAARVGLHKPESGRSEDYFTPHCCRYWFTTHLIRNGMPREYVKELRGDARKDALDIYNTIDRKDLLDKYLACIPHLGI
jgi:integrase/recombinase XerD